jgi:exodeoxyribonuclease V alpha subunit
MLQRNLLYTAITRGKKLVVLVGSRKALAAAVQRQDTARRYTLLRQRLAASESASSESVAEGRLLSEPRP